MIKKLLAIIVLVLVASLSIAGCTTTTSNTNQTPTATNQNGANQPTVSVTATYLGASNSLSQGPFAPAAAASGNKFVKYAIYCENINAPNKQMGNPAMLMLRDTNGNIYSDDSSSAFMQQQVNGVTLKGLSLSYEIHSQQGDKVSGLIAFQIPTNATPKSLTYDDYTNIITIHL
jgi:hypothetical protein